MTYSCIVVDDESMSREIILKFVEQTEYLLLSGAFSNAIDASNAIKKQAVDIIFLDVEMPEMSGLEFLKLLKDKPQIILTTSQEKYAVEAFEYEVLDYLLKPVTYTRFLKAVSKAMVKFEETENNAVDNKNIFLKVDSKLVKVELEELYMVEALGDYVIVHTMNKKFTVFSTMKGIEKSLPKTEFLRVHRSYIIRIDKIQDIQDNNLVIKGKVIPIGPSYKSDLIKRLNII